LDLAIEADDQELVELLTHGLEGKVAESQGSFALETGGVEKDLSAESLAEANFYNLSSNQSA